MSLKKIPEASVKGKLSDDTVEINTRAPVWMKDLNGNNNLQDITIKIESGEPQYEILEKTEQTIEETCCLSEGVRVRNVYKIETNKYMQVTDRKFVEYKVKDCITTEAFSLTHCERRWRRGLKEGSRRCSSSTAGATPGL